MNQQEQDECFDALIFSLTALTEQFDPSKPDELRVIGTIQNAAQALIELKTADNLHCAIIRLHEKIAARHFLERNLWKAERAARPPQ